MKKLKYLFEFIAFWLFITLCRLLPLDTASAFCGWMGKAIGPKLKLTQRALYNMSVAFPEITDEEKQKILRDMWDNLGRVLAEYPHLEEIGKNRVKMEAPDNVINLIKSGGPSVFISGHTGNWEISGSCVYLQYDAHISPVYRATNNPYVDKMIRQFRSLNGQLTSYPKSSKGMRDLVKALKDGKHIAILIDQKYNKGASVPFFGEKARTSTAFADLASRFKCPVIPYQVQRLDGAHFRLQCFDTLELTSQDGTPKPSEDLVLEAHKYLEDFIRTYPAQWLWPHRRWGKNMYR